MDNVKDTREPGQKSPGGYFRMPRVDLDTDDLSCDLLVIFHYTGINRFSNFLHKAFLRNLILGNSYILIVRMHELFKKRNISCLDSPSFTVIMEAQQNIHEKIQFWCYIRVHWFGTEQEFRNRHELINEKIYIQF